MPAAQVNIQWEQLPGLKLRAYREVGARGYEYGLRELDMEPIHNWCAEMGFGARTSFDTWRFKTDQELTAFLLRWS
jgi:hypothetical protein